MSINFWSSLCKALGDGTVWNVVLLNTASVRFIDLNVLVKLCSFWGDGNIKLPFRLWYNSQFSGCISEVRLCIFVPWVPGSSLISSVFHLLVEGLWTILWQLNFIFIEVVIDLRKHAILIHIWPHQNIYLLHHMLLIHLWGDSHFWFRLAKGLLLLEVQVS